MPRRTGAESFDVAVVGAGPAGSTAAHRLATAGARVLLLDGARFPRDKPCGGGVTMRAARLLPFDLAPVAEDRIHRLRLGSGYERSVEHRFRKPVALMTQRRRLDLFLVERAAEAGADFRDGTKVRGLEPDGPSAMVVDLGKAGRVGADLVLGADGANGVCARSLGLDAGTIFAVALEANARLDAGQALTHRGRVSLELDVVPGGYSWVFPKAEHVNLGVGGWMSEGPRLRAHLARLAEVHGLALDDLTDLRGYRLPMRSGWGNLVAGRAAAIGDAAGLVDPLSGDGMFEAMLSAKVASEVAMEVLEGRLDSLEPYAGRLRRALAIHAATAWAAKAAVELMPAVSWQVLRSRPARMVLEARLTGAPVESGGLLASGTEAAARLALGSRAREARSTEGGWLGRLHPR